MDPSGADLAAIHERLQASAVELERTGDLVSFLFWIWLGSLLCALIAGLAFAYLHQTTRNWAHALLCAGVLMPIMASRGVLIPEGYLRTQAIFLLLSQIMILLGAAMLVKQALQAERAKPRDVPSPPIPRRGDQT